MRKAKMLVTLSALILLSAGWVSGCASEEGGDSENKAAGLAPNATPQQKAEFDAAQKAAEQSRQDALGR
ncbi:MAG: hypothetical protein OHK0029_13630 [Armatimonadaceae bacterium]